MIARRLPSVPLLALLLLACSALPALAAGGGAAPDVLILPGNPPAVVRFGNPLTSATAGGISLTVRATAMQHGRLHVTGTAPAQLAGGVRVEQLDATRGWLPAATAAVAADGSFEAAWRPARAGVLQLRAVPASSPSAPTGSAAGTAAASPQVGVTVYRPGVASWYGPGAYGTRTACGVTLRRWTLGVAHRTLPCGTLVAFYYRGRTILVPVIDRGPFAAGRTWDLTLATARGLGAAEGLVRLGALAVPAAP